MSEKRATDLINLGMVNKTQKIFPDETKLILRSLNFMRRLTGITDKAVIQFEKQRNLQAVMDLFCRNRELVHFSIVCVFNGGYAETKILSRVGLENFLLIRLFIMKPDLAKDWFSDPETFRKRWSPNKIRRVVFANNPSYYKSYTEFYSLLCDYTHPSFKGWIELLKKKKNGFYIGWRPEFNTEYISECIGLICWITIQSTKGYLDAFKKWLTDELISEANWLLPKVHEMIVRHFEVRIYDKKKAVG